MIEYELPQGSGPKKPNRKLKLTKLQYEIYQKCYDDVNGPLFFASHCCWVNRNGLVRYVPFDYQREMLFNLHNYQNTISLWSRQNGKTATSLTYVLWYAMKYPYKEILITSFGEESANKNLADVKMLYENCPDFLKRGIIAMNESTIKFDNKSKIFSRPTTLKAPRGLSPALIYCDEFAFVGTAGASKGAQMQEEFYAAISPALSASKGKLAITSTPISETDKFYNLWSNAIKKTNDDGTDIPKQYILEINGEKYQDFHLFQTKEEAEEYVKTLNNNENIKIIEREPPGNNGFVSQLVKWDACPLKDENWAKSEIKKVGEERFQREYNCLSGKNMIKILDKNGQVFDISIENFYNFY